MLIAWFDEEHPDELALVGAKASGLGRLRRAGFPVPPGFTVTSAAFECSLERHGLTGRLQRLFAGLGEDPVALTEASARARDEIVDNGPHPEVERAVRQAYRELVGRLDSHEVAVAVRSSASAEDLPGASFAGQQDTYLWVRGEDDVVNRVVWCWASLFTDRAVRYRLDRGYPVVGVTMAVAVQQMVLPVAAGVALSLDPRNGDRSKIVIDSAFGLGEAVVSGAVTPDHFTVDKVLMEIVGRTVSCKSHECVVAGDRVGLRALEPERAAAPSLADSDIVRLARLVRRVEQHFGCPQDVEWAVVARPTGPPRLVVLQSRPETVWSRDGAAPDDTPHDAVGGVVDTLTTATPGPATDAVFPLPHEVVTPAEAAGWEHLYPASLLLDVHGADDERFWFRDGVHWSRAVSPFDVTVLEYALTSLSQYNSRFFMVPGARGVECRIVAGYCYLSPVPVEDPDEVARRAEWFRDRAGFYYEHWDELYGRWMDKVRGVIGRLEDISFPPLPDMVDRDELRSGRGLGPPHDLLHRYHRLLDHCLELWQHHFEFLNLGYAAYLDFFAFCSRTFPGIPDLAVARMVAGIDVDLFRPDEELRRLAHRAVELGLGELVTAGTVAEALLRLPEEPAAADWWADYCSVRDPWFNYSNGSGMYHDDAVWADRPDIPLGFLRGYVSLLLAGEAIDSSRPGLLAERDRIAGEYAEALQGAVRQQFLSRLELARRVFHYVENHNFYVEHWGLSVFWRKMRDLSRVFVDAGVWPDDDAIFLLRREEIDRALWELTAHWAVGRASSRPNPWPAELEHRRRILAACEAWTPPPVLGVPPEVVTEPFTIMLWGVTSESLRNWSAPRSDGDLTGFAASPGIAVGPARVIHSAEEILDVRAGEVLVTSLTAPSWAPVFRRIAATVTDTGGIMSHAAIVCREYGLPAVTGTGRATAVIRTGQLVEVDGTTGRVRILDPAEPAGRRAE